MSHSKISGAFWAVTAAALLAACGGGGGGGSVLPKPSAAPSNAPSPIASSTPSPHASSSPSMAPSGAPTASPTGIPSGAPTASPTAAPTASPTAAPTASPTAAPTPHNYFVRMQGLPNGSSPYAITADAQKVWFTDRGVHAIGSAPTAGGSAQENYLAGGIDPLEIAPDHLGSLVYSEASGSSYGSFTPGISQFNQVTLPSISSELTQRGIVADSSGRVYVAVGNPGTTTPTQGIYTVNGVLGLGAGIVDPTAVLFDSNDGYLWVADRDSAVIEAMKTDGSIVSSINTEYKSKSLAEVDGVVYAVDGDSSVILRVAVPYNQAAVAAHTSCGASYIAAGVGRDLWFTEPTCHKIGHYVTNTGTMTEIVNPIAPSGSPDHIAVDPLGRVWFTDSATHQIFEYYP